MFVHSTYPYLRGCQGLWQVEMITSVRLFLLGDNKVEFCAWLLCIICVKSLFLKSM